MAFFDKPLEQLQVYKPERTEPKDFDSFWQETLSQTRQHPLNAKFEPANFYLETVETYDVTFNGYQGQPIKGWFIVPKHRAAKVPCVVEYIGYGGGRGLANEWLLWSAAGYAHLVMDTRGQGSTWRKGDTPDLQPEGGNAHYPGFMTLGILDPKTYYYRRVFTDAVRAVEAARTHPLVDEKRIAVSGASQGGGISIAVAGLDHGVAATLPDVPFLCHYRRATEITDQMPYKEIAHYCKVQREHEEKVFNTLAYFDGMNFAPRATAKALFSVALMDMVCPPSTVYAAYNHYAGTKHINVWKYNGHEGGEVYQQIEKLKFLKELFG